MESAIKLHKQSSLFHMVRLCNDKTAIAGRLPGNLLINVSPLLCFVVEGGGRWTSDTVDECYRACCQLIVFCTPHLRVDLALKCRRNLIAAWYKLC